MVDNIKDNGDITMPKVICPCCHGMKKVILYDYDTETIIARVDCSHCEGTGEVEAEVEENGDK